MKKTIFISFIFAILLACHFSALLQKSPTVLAQSDDIVYAQITSPAVLYSKDGDNYAPVVTLPATYFVALLEEESQAEYLYVSYLDITGYMKKADLEITDYEPVTKYAKPVFTASNEGLSAIMRSTPDHDGDNVLALVPDGTKLLYYGKTEGSSRYEGTSAAWYYVKYEFGGTVMRGYIYDYHGVAEPIADNIIEKVEKPAPEQPPTDNGDQPITANKQPHLSNVQSAVFIVCLCIPAVLIMILLFRAPPQKKRKPRNYRE